MEFKDTKINILGQDYSIMYKTEEEDAYLENNLGTCDSTRKIITIKEWEEGIGTLDKKVSMNETIRHEIIHAFLSESGLQNCSNNAQDEEMIDWLSLQIPKMIKSCKNYIDENYNGEIKINTSDINILGSVYKIRFANKENDEVLINKDLYTDSSTKRIVFNDKLKNEPTVFDFDNPLHNINTIIRKDIIYCYIWECGLGRGVKWSRNDNLIEWIARQFPKMIKAMEEYL